MHITRMETTISLSSSSFQQLNLICKVDKMLNLMTTFFSLFAYICCFSEAILIQDLGGNGIWTAINANKSIKVPSRVPGSIYSDLERAKTIPEIYRDFNDVSTRWVSYDNWTFERLFDVDSKVLAMKHIYLTAHGLDTVGTVTLNGRVLGSVDNMFVRYRWAVKEFLNTSGNQLSIQFESAPIVSKRMYEKVLKEKYSIPPTCTPDVQSGECHVNMIRKMQASFSWDWGPAFPTQGIWKPIELEAFNELILRTVSVDTQKRDPNQWVLNYTLHLEGAPSTETHGIMTLSLDGKRIVDNATFNVHFDAKGEAVVGHVALVDSVKHSIKAWYPNGYGTQQLYNLTVSLNNSNGETADKSIKIGFRTVKLVQNRLESKTEAYSFYFSVNDQPIYSKGSNWIPAHALHESLSEEYIRELLKSAQLANINMLRVWGGGIYEDDRFYEIADEFGILIWQDFMFACALYPNERTFMDSVKVEIAQQVRRLQYHPSIALWAGNNENEVAIASDWWGIRPSEHYEDYRADYRALYIHAIKPIVEGEDLSRPYVSSSPSNGVKDSSENYTASDPQAQQYGDVHYYMTMGNIWDWKMYPSPKFASEYGFQSWSSLQTLEKSISKDNLTYPLDRTFVHREHSDGQLENLNAMIEMHMRMPTPGNVTTLEHYIYLTQIFQSMAIKTETEHYRRNRAVDIEDGTGNTMGALYWQLNDIWPTVSWASLEFGGKWKMLHYFVQDMFDNLLVSAYVDEGELKVVVIRDDHQPEVINFTLQINVFDWSQLPPIHQQHVQVQSKPFSVTLCYNKKLDNFLQTANCKGINHCFIEVIIFESNARKGSNFLLVGEPKDAIGLQKANVQIKSISESKTDSQDAHSKEFTIQLETDHLALFVWLDFVANSDLIGIFSDNGFMMTSRNVSLTFKTSHSISKEKLKETLTVKSLKDVE